MQRVEVEVEGMYILQDRYCIKSSVGYAIKRRSYSMSVKHQFKCRLYTSFLATVQCHGKQNMDLKLRISGSHLAPGGQKRQIQP